MTNIKLDRYDQVSITLLLIILVVSALDMLSGRLRLWVLEGKMSVWHMQPDLAASRRQHKQLYQVGALPALRRAGGASLPALLRLVFLQFGISGEQLTTGLQQIGRYGADVRLARLLNWPFGYYFTQIGVTAIVFAGTLTATVLALLLSSSPPATSCAAWCWGPSPC